MRGIPPGTQTTDKTTFFLSSWDGHYKEIKQQRRDSNRLYKSLLKTLKISKKKFIFFFLIKINKELIDIQSDRGLLLDHTNIITKRPSRTADDEIMKQSRKDERRNVNFNPVPVYLNDRKI